MSRVRHARTHGIGQTSGPRMAAAFDAGVTTRRATFPYGTLTAVPCPDCPALEGEKCIAAMTGARKTTVHVSRRRVALRKYYADLEAGNG